MTKKQYKKLGMHWSILNEAQREHNMRLDLIKLLVTIADCRRVWGKCSTLSTLWKFYVIRKNNYRL